MKVFLKLSLLAFILTVLYSCSDEPIEINNSNDYEEFLKDEMDFQNIPALSSLIFKEGVILEELYLGKSNIAQNVALEDDHLFLLASVSKVVTATALLQLYEEGLFSLDDPINDYLPFEVNVPNQSTDISFRMLLKHTSGIADANSMDDQYYYGQDPTLELDYYIENYLVPGGEFYDASENYYNFEPGTDYEYSNIGNALIGVLVEEISGMDFNTYCKQNIFTPLEMSNTHWRLDEISETIVQPYEYRRRDYEVIQHYTFTDYPNGGLRSTVRDMFKFISAFVQDGMSNNYQLLNPSTIDKMITPQIPGIANDMGLHLFLLDGKNNIWGHDGGELGVATIMGFNPETKVGAIIFANQGDADLEEILTESYEYALKL